MGRDKARLRLDGRTLLTHIRATASQLDMPVRVIRRDLVPRCGPLGGIFTALHTTTADAVLFLSCDMPFVSKTLLEKLCAIGSKKIPAVFTAENQIVGFPCALQRTCLPIVEAQLHAQNFSLQSLANQLSARHWSLPLEQRMELFNVNTPADWALARRWWREQHPRTASGKSKSAPPLPETRSL